MNTKLDPSKQESSSIPSVSSVGGTASASTAPLFLRRSWQDSSFKAKAEGASLSAAAVTAYCDSLEEEEESSQSLSDSLNCDRIKSGTLKHQSQEFHSEFSDSLEDSADDTDDTSFESDTCSFYSVQSQLTPCGNSREAPNSLLGSEYLSEGTLYDSAQSLLTPTPSCQSSFWSVRSFTALDGNRQAPLSYQADKESDHHRTASGFYIDCTSCPDLSPTGIRKGPHRPSWVDSFQVSQALSHCDVNSSGLDNCNSSALIIRSQSDSTMSAVEGSASPKVGDEFETKKKKGLMSSFRKSRKTSRKLRQQKKAANDGDSTSTGTGVMSDGEQDLLIDSEPSAPNSPAPVKNDLLKDETTDIEIPVNKNSETSLDCHQATHERLNGTSSPKESSEPSSKNSSPLMGKSNKIAETAKKFEDKEDKKAGKNKFGSSLFRKKKAEQLSTQQPSKDASDTTVSETTGTKEQPKTEQEQPSTDDSLPEGTAEVAVPEQPGAADVKSSSFRSYISSVQLVKNWTVNSEVPKSQLNPQALAKTSREAVDGGRAAVEGKSAAPEETSTTTIETKKVTTASANGKPSATEAGASTDKREHLYKILVIGELGTGKTSIIKRYVHQFFSQHYRATIGVDFALKVLNWDNNTVIRLQLWDIAGQERFGNMTRVYYKEAVGAFVVFDVTRAQTFDAVTKWKTDLDTKVTLADGSPIPAVLLANKCDQPKEGVVNNPARMDDYCRERGFSGWFETSAKENINIDEASRFLVNKILSNEKQGMMMTESLDTDKFSVDGKANPVDRSGCRC
ncbi:uncharacterized protein [Macrobrachium rosenbergii]|uniref:uncharacterized protein isoform X1 n=1 Tax=Macrobrachium rosenbergii TaxID=79674 RepID=UPI0034D4A40B